MQTPHMQALVAIHMPDTSVTMDISQSQPRPKMCTCYNCGKPGHLSCACMKPWKQRIWLATLAKMDIKSLMAEAMAVAMDVREVSKKSKQAKEPEKTEMDFQAGQW